jgi:hypothetical protein
MSGSSGCSPSLLPASFPGPSGFAKIVVSLDQVSVIRVCFSFSFLRS